MERGERVSGGCNMMNFFLIFQFKVGLKLACNFYIYFPFSILYLFIVQGGRGCASIFKKNYFTLEGEAGYK